MIYLIITVVFGGLLYQGWKMTSRSAYESAAFSVIESDGSFELREYPDLMLATTEMGARVEGDNGSFGRLFRYITGGNESEQKVAMTTPVFMAPKSDHASGQMGFVIPKEVAESTIPQPSSEKVQLTKRFGGKFAVIRFAGRFDEAVRKQQQIKLEKWMRTKGYEFADDVEFASYDPPWTPGPLRRNEILIRITTAETAQTAH